jgi:hypothetical protein
MPKTFFSAAAIAALSFVALDAQAFPLSNAPSVGSDVTLVEGGCGPGFHRNEFGHCRPNRGPAVIVEPGAPVVVAPAAPVVVVEPRGCGPGWHWSREFGRCVR